MNKLIKNVYARSEKRGEETSDSPEGHFVYKVYVLHCSSRKIFLKFVLELFSLFCDLLLGLCRCTVDDTLAYFNKYSLFS